MHVRDLKFKIFLGEAEPIETMVFIIALMHHISPNKKSPDPEKMQCMKNMIAGWAWKNPNNLDFELALMARTTEWEPKIWPKFT